MTVTARNRSLVYQRDEQLCVACGTDQDMTLQHRANRGMGGSKSRDRVENLVCMCSHHNQLLEMDAEFAQRGRRLGWKLNSWDNPLDCPVFYVKDGAFFYLSGRGTRIKKEK